MMPKDREITADFTFAGALVFLDVVVFGACFLSALFCPIWFIASIFQNVIRKPGWKIVRVRIAIPIVTLATTLSISAIGWTIAASTANRIVVACDQFNAANGRYPKDLGELIPTYMLSIPRAKYCLFMGEFGYCNSDGHAMLWWYKVPPFGREVFGFRDHGWTYLD
jgi:hypothetical protein